MSPLSTPTPAFQLERQASGQLVYTDAAGLPHPGVIPVRAFPISAPDEGLSLVSTDGHELLWIEAPSQLPEALRTLLAEELAQREFAPQILRLTHVSTFSTPSTWDVDTDRGPTQLVLKTEEDIRRLGDGRLLILAEHGLQFSVPDMRTLDRASKKLLERFL